MYVKSGADNLTWLCGVRLSGIARTSMSDGLLGLHLQQLLCSEIDTFSRINCYLWTTYGHE